MPKKIYQLKDFSGGLNNLKDPADIKDNEVSDVNNMTFTQQGAVGGGFNIRDNTNNLVSAYSNVHIDHLEPGYGLGYFETDFVRDPVIKEVTTADQSGGSEDGFQQDQSTRALSMKVSGSAVNLTTSYTVGTRVLITAPSYPANSIDANGQGLYTVVGHHSNDIILDRNITISAEGTQVYWAATVKGYPLGDRVLLLAHPDEHKIDVYSTNSASGSILTVDDLTPTPVDDASDGAAWATSQSHTGITGVSNATGSGLTCSIATDGSGDPTFTITSVGTGYVVDEEITFTDPHASTANTAVLIVATISKWNQDEITLRSTATGLNSKVLYHKVNDSIRVFDTTDKNDSKVQWYGWINRKHFQLLSSLGGSTTDDNSYLGYFAKDNDLARPTDGACVDGGTTPAVSSFPDVGEGFDFNISTNTGTDGLIRAGIYVFAQSFIYDGNQESLLTEYSTEVTVDDADDFKVFSVNVGAKSPYDPRISGGRIYIKEKDSESEYILLVDINLTKGCRTNLSDEYTTFRDGGSSNYSSPTTSASDNFIIKDLSFINYETINGYPSSIFTNALGDQGEFWKDSTIANNRVFICNVTMKDEDSGISKATASVKNYPDRIMYSMPNRFDTFPEFNTIEAAKGDADYYVAIESFADRILAFKQVSMDIINIASPSDTNWFLEESKNYMGVSFHGAVVKTQYGIIWVNKYGLFAYDGSKITNLTENKIDDSTWHGFVEDNTMLIYDQVTSLVYIIRSAGSGNADDGDAYMCDLKKGNFTFLKDFAHDSITNPIDIYFSSSPNVLVGYSTGSSIWHFQLYRSYQNSRYVNLTTKNLDFGDPNIMKKIYAVYITYKTNVNISAEIDYSVDGGATWVTLSGSTVTSASVWKKGKWTGGSLPVTTSTFMVRLDIAAVSDANVQEINDIGIEYRPIYKKMA